MAQLVIPSFGGGVVLQGSPDAKATDELGACASFDIGERGQLVASSTPETFATMAGGDHVMALAPALLPGGGDALIVTGPVAEVGRASPTAIVTTYSEPVGSTNVPANGFIVTVASVPYDAAAGTGTPSNPVLVNIGRRESIAPGIPFTCDGLWVFGNGGAGPAVQLMSASQFDVLGTGPYSEGFTGGTKGKFPVFAGIAAYNNHIFGYNGGTTAGISTNRLMFSNTGKPLKWGNDNQGTAGDRDYTDSDGINIGAAGDNIRCCYSWGGKLWIATDKELHWLAGYGRESFITDGTNVQARENALGPHAMIEGPDGLLYGLGSNGLWVFDGTQMDVVGRKLVDFAGKSTGWWDLIWTDTTHTATYPGVTNQDMAWMLADRVNKQVWVVIPCCNATTGTGFGTDTVIIKYHTLTGGFTRHVLASTEYTAGCALTRSAKGPDAILLAGKVGGGTVVHRYGFKADASVSPTIASPLPSATFGPYAPFGPHGTGVHRVCYVTLAWEAATSLPLVFTMTPTVDGQAASAVKVSMQATPPAAPADGDYWLDTSGTDANLGTGTAGAFASAAVDYVWKTYSTSRLAWMILPRGGQKGFRATLRLAYTPMRGTRVQFDYATTSAAGRFQIESLGLEPSAAREAA